MKELADSSAINTLEETTIKGRVLSASSNKYTVDLGQERVVINARKKIKYRSGEILTGDFVEVVDDAISKVYPRTSRFIRPNIANIDTPNYVRRIPVLNASEDLSVHGLMNTMKNDVFGTGTLPYLQGGVVFNGCVEDPTIGEKIYSDWTKADLYNVFPAFTYLVNLIKTNFPDAKVYCIINNCMKEEIVEFYGSVCKANDIGVILLHDIDKIQGHPTIKGMLEIKKQILEHIESK